MPNPSSTAVLKRFGDTLRSEGLCEALRVLNAVTGYRFSAVYVFNGGVLHNICLVDKQDPLVTQCDDLPLGESYCVFIKRTGMPFALEHARQDESAMGHPKQEDVQSYYGIPLVGESGHLIGTACHFDTMPVRLSGDVVSLLDSAAPMLTEELTRLSNRTTTSV